MLVILGTMSGHGSYVLCVDFCPDNTHFATSSSDRKVKVWDAGMRRCVHTFSDHNDQVVCPSVCLSIYLCVCLSVC